MSSDLTVVAEYPLGVYRGSDFGNPSPYPSTARLFSALVHAASKGSTAEEVDGDLHPSDQAITALRWLEEHPPTLLYHPQRKRLSSARNPMNNYVPEGILCHNKQKGWQYKKRLRQASLGYAVGGPFAWTWQDAPGHVKETIATICADVSCLGETDSPVVLRVVDPADAPQPTLTLAVGANALTATQGTTIWSPMAGRLDALERSHAATRGAKRPSASADKHKSSELPAPSPITTEALVEAIYQSTTRRSEAPWELVIPLVMSLERQNAALKSDDGPVEAIAPTDRVALCVALHRALASRLPEGTAPQSITGAPVRRGAPTAANRVAIHIVDRMSLSATDLEGQVRDGSCVFLVMIPRGMAAGDLALLQQALKRVSRVTTASGRREDGQLIAARPNFLDSVPADSFWNTPAAGHVRLWSAAGVVPETRRQRQLENWTLHDSAQLSLGFVFRDELDVDPSLRGAERYAETIRKIAERGSRTVFTQQITRNPGAYAHRLPAGVVAQPYNAVLDGGTLINGTELLAIGQSRHLGGGLLTPLDVPESVANLWRNNG